MVGELVWDPLQTVLDSFINVLPGLSAFVVIIAVGILASWVLGRLVAGILRGTGLDRWYHKLSLDKAVGSIVPSSIMGTVIKFWVFITFFATATDFLDLGPISVLLSQLASWLPNLIVGSLILLFGWFAANLSYDKIKNPRVEASNILAFVAKVIILVFTVLITFSQIGIKISLAEKSILIILSGIMLGVAIAIGLGFADIFRKKGDRILSYFRENI